MKGHALAACACLLLASSACTERSGDAGRSPAPPSTSNGAAEQRLRDAAFAGATEEVVAALEAGADVGAQDREGRNGLMLAAYNGHAATLGVLLERGAEVDQRDRSGRTALMYAASGPFAESVELLLEHGADPNLSDGGEGWTALMFAAGEGQLEVVRTLLRHGADRAARDADGDAAIDHALRRRHSEVVALLDRPGAAQAGGTPR